MIAWCLNAVIVALLLSVAAWLLEQSARHQSRPGRWVWMGSLALSGFLALSSLWWPSSTTSGPTDAVAPPTDSWRQSVVPSIPMPVLLAQEQVERRIEDGSNRFGAESTLHLKPEAVCIALSTCMLAVLALNAWTLRRRVRQWRKVVLLGTVVYVAPDVGPAVVGLFRPRIVIPEWLLASSTPQQVLVLAHEQAHLDGRDPQCLAVALLLLVAMPWNLPLWWQVARLRRAMEVDCDARVLSCGHSLRAYGEVLLAVGQRVSTRLGLSNAMSGSTSFLERRIAIMLTARKLSAAGRVVAALFASLGLALAAAATGLSPPQSPSADTSAALDGEYQTGEQEVLHVSHEGVRLFMQSTGRPRVEWKVRGPTELFALNGRQRATVRRDEQGHVDALVLHFHGTNLAALRISAAQAQRIADDVAKRIRQQVASPGTAAAIERFFAQILLIPIKLDGLSPLMAAGIREQNQQLRPLFTKLGAMRSVEFAGVSETGYDKYLMRCENGSVLWDILLDADGTIARVNFTFPSF